MSADTSLFHVEHKNDNPELLKQLHVKPPVSWPVVGILAVALPLALLLIVAVTLEWINPWLAAIPGSLIGFYLFTPIHEAVHRSASNQETVNNLIAMLTINLLLPYVSHKLLRWGHMQHHRFTNEVGKDPDRMLTNHWYGALVLWPFFELFYLPQYFKAAAQRPKSEVRQVIWQIPFGLAALGLLFAFCGWKLFLFWFVSSRVGLWLIVFVFVYLPHHPHDTLQKDDIYGASSMREGNDWLLTILMAGQNRHLVHHLYPTVPFYRMKQAWEARQAFHESHNPARVRAFALEPVRESRQEAAPPHSA
jgi:beta-carotene hydroxylase